MTAEKTMSCSWSDRCGGCTTIGQTYEATLKEKEAMVQRLLKAFGKPDRIVGMDDPYYYRNKVHRVCSFQKEGRRDQHLFGIYAEGTHRVVPVRKCLIEDAGAQEILDTVSELARQFKIRSYDESTRQGLLRHVLIRTAHATGQVMVVLVLTNPVLPGKSHFVKALRERHPEITTIVINVNSRATSLILGERESVAYGKGYIEDLLCGMRFRISPRSFYQVNSIQTEKLYARAMDMAGLKGREKVVDAYCGIGTIGLIASKHAGQVIGVESNKAAVQDAILNAKANQVRNIRFIAEDAGQFLAKLSASDKADVIFMDPPREGASDEFLGAAAAAHPGRIVYISCNPVTLARDLKQLTRLGYKVREIAPFDLFPWTGHVETVVLLTRNT